MSFSEEVLVQAHGFIRNQREQLNKSHLVGCFHCCQMIHPFTINMILQWVNDGTALCPLCGTDSLIGSDAVTPITHEFLRCMNQRWFGHPSSS